MDILVSNMLVQMELLLVNGREKTLGYAVDSCTQLVLKGEWDTVCQQ